MSCYFCRHFRTQHISDKDKHPGRVVHRTGDDRDLLYRYWDGDFVLFKCSVDPEHKDVTPHHICGRFDLWNLDIISDLSHRAFSQKEELKDLRSRNKKLRSQVRELKALGK
jgi:hypothetical protein